MTEKRVTYERPEPTISAQEAATIALEHWRMHATAKRGRDLMTMTAYLELQGDGDGLRW